MNNFQVSNLEKIYWPKAGYTKGDLIDYTLSVSKWMLPHLKDRPITLKRYPEGIDGEMFYQKDTSSLHLPEFVKTVEIQQEKLMRYILIQNAETLEYVVNLGTIEIHPFLSRVKHLDSPDYLVVDLDPEDIAFEHVVETANAVHGLLESIDVPSYCKTSGGRGLHIFVPMHAKYSFEQVKQFGEVIASLVHDELPDITSLLRKPSQRQKKVYIDVYQNNRGQTLIVPYGVRGKPFAPVSTPLEWREVKKGLNPLDYTIKTVAKRVEKIGDIFKPVLGKGINLETALKKLEKSFHPNP